MSFYLLLVVIIIVGLYGLTVVPVKVPYVGYVIESRVIDLPGT